LFPVPPVFVAYPFHQAYVQQAEYFPHFAHSELAIVVYPTSNFELHQFSNPADWEVYPTMKIHRFQLACYPAHTLLADGRANLFFYIDVSKARLIILIYGTSFLLK
jgi:hypothetical protein